MLVEAVDETDVQAAQLSERFDRHPDRRRSESLPPLDPRAVDMINSIDQDEAGESGMYRYSLHRFTASALFCPPNPKL